MSIELENIHLRAELGTNPLYAWKHTRDLFMIVQKVIEGQPQYDYKANPETGLIELHPIMMKMPMLRRLTDNWVLARWVAANQEACVKQLCGVKVFMPPDGIWQPFEITALRSGIKPRRSDTDYCIQGVRGQRAAIQDLFDNAEERQDKAALADSKRFADACRDQFTAGFQVPGTKGAVSFPTPQPVERTNANSNS